MKIVHNIIILLIFSMILILLGCDENPTEVEDYEYEAVLTAYIYNGEPVNYVYLEWIAPINEEYYPEDYYIHNALIKLYPIDNPSVGDTAYLFYTSNGYYQNNSLIPQGGVTYGLEATVASEDLYIWAETTVPDTFSLSLSPYPLISGTYPFPHIPYPLDWNDEKITLNWTGADHSAGSIYSSVKIFEENEILQHLDPEWNEEDDGFPGMQEVQILGQSTREMEIPWIMFSWVGLHVIQLQAANTPCLEYMDSAYLEGDNNPISNVHGGLGIFAGVARNIFIVNMERVD